ncbi:hypothetical protein ACWC9R_04415 [Streptomyces sp. NPDC001219]
MARDPRAPPRPTPLERSITTTTPTGRRSRPGTLARRVAAADWPAPAVELDTLSRP